MTVDDRMVQALRDADELIARGKWVRIRHADDVVHLDYGAILSDGTKEQSICTRSYYGRGKYTSQAHL